MRLMFLHQQGELVIVDEVRNDCESNQCLCRDHRKDRSQNFNEERRFLRKEASNV